MRKNGRGRFMETIDNGHTLTAQEVELKLKTSLDGLTTHEAKRRLSLFGRNVLEEEETNRFKIFFRQLNNILIYILLLASLISIFLGEWVDFFVINLVIVINTLIGFWQEVKAQTSLQALRKMTESRSRVLRDGDLVLVSSAELVPGDIVVIHEGELVTADMRVVEVHGLMIDESSITGESLPVAKDGSVSLPLQTLPYDLTNMVLSGTIVVRGKGKAIVVKTGEKTYFGSIVEESKTMSRPTPLMRALGFFAKNYIFLLLILFTILGIYDYLNGRSWVDILYFLIVSLVSAVPEGLPLVVTIAMIFGALALSKNKVLIRYLPCVETLGSATVIASDKTGTITEGKLVVREVFSRDDKLLYLIAALCNDAEEGLGDPLDVALSRWVQDYDAVRFKYPRHWSYPFDAQLMLMATVHEHKGSRKLFIKGAFEALKEKAEDQKEVAHFEEVVHRFSDQGLRVLALGMGDWKGEEPTCWKIRLIGLIGFLDPPKEGVKEAVLKAKEAGIKVVMITGDHPKTAKAVAKEVSIWKEGDGLVTGKEMEAMDDEHLFLKLKSATVLARILPAHKLRVIKVFQQKGEIVAVSGDGVNDIPALKMADLAIAMGSGMEAAKSVSQMVITDNNLCVIVKAIQNGRIIVDNIRKVIYYLLSTSLQEIFIISFAILFVLPLPLSPVQILWINLVTDGVQDKLFAFAKEEGHVMRRKPRESQKLFFDGVQIFRILFFGISVGLICFFLYRTLLQFYSFEKTSTILFCCIAAAQWANGIQAQKESEPFFVTVKRSFKINPLIFLGATTGLALQLVAIYGVPSWFKAVPLDLYMWKYPVFVFFSAFFIVEIRKWFEWTWVRF